MIAYYQKMLKVRGDKRLEVRKILELYGSNKSVDFLFGYICRGFRINGIEELIYMEQLRHHRV